MKSYLHSFFLLLCLLLGSLSIIHAIDYKVQVLVPTTSGTESEQMLQWISVMKLAADQVSASWSTHTLSVEIIDYYNSPTIAMVKAIEAVQDNTVLALINAGDEHLTEALSLLCTTYNLTHLAPHIESTGLNTTGLSFYSLRPNITFGPSTLYALLNFYNWDKVGLVYVQDDPNGDMPHTSAWKTVTLVREELLKISDIDFVAIPVAPTAKTHWDVAEHIILDNLNAVILVTSDVDILHFLLGDFETAGLLDGRRAFIYYNHEGASELNLPQGVLTVQEVTAYLSNMNIFETLVHSQNPSNYPGLGPSAAVDNFSLFFYEAVNVLANSIKLLGLGSPVTRQALINQVRSTVYNGLVGEVEFRANGFRENGNAVVLSSLGPTAGNDRVFAYNGTLEELLTPVWPGRTTVVPDVELEILPIPIIAPFNVGVSDAINNVTRQLLKYSVERLNTLGYLPPKYQVLPVLLDHVKSPSLAVRHSLNATRIGAVGVIGSSVSTMSVLIQDVVSAWDIPQISPGATDPDLSVKELYPTFMRVCSKSNYQASTFITMAQQFGWTEWSLISVESDITGELLDLSLAAGITVVNQVSIDPLLPDYQEPLVVFAKTRPRVVVLLVDSENISAVAKAMFNVGLAPLAVLVNDALLFLDVSAYTDFDNIPRTFFDGWIALGQPAGSGNLSEALITEIRALSPSEYPGVYDLYIGAPLFDAFFEAALVFADAIKRTVASSQNPRDGPTLLASLLNTNMMGITGQIDFDRYGDREATFEVRNVQNGTQVNVGRWTASSGLQMFGNAIVWPDGTTQVPSATVPRTLTWLKWSSGAGIVLALLAALGLAICAFVAVVVFQQRLSPVILSSTWQFLLVMIVGAMFGFGSVFTWIGKPKEYLCALRIWIPAMGFILISAPLLAKTWRLHRIFTLSNMRITPIPLSRLVLLLVATVLVQLIICIFWISLGTFKPIIVNSSDDATIAYVVCSSNLAYRVCSYITYSYLGILIVTCCYLAFRVRKLPKDFNESRWIAIAVYNILLFAVVIIILGYALSKFPVITLVLICVCTLAISFGSIASMMLPKLWELWKHPERRSSSSESSTKMRTTTSRTTPPSKQELTPPGSPATYRKRTDYSINSKSSKSAYESEGPAESDLTARTGTPATHRSASK